MAASSFKPGNTQAEAYLQVRVESHTSSNSSLPTPPKAPDAPFTSTWQTHINPSTGEEYFVNQRDGGIALKRTEVPPNATVKPPNEAWRAQNTQLFQETSHLGDGGSSFDVTVSHSYETGSGSAVRRHGSKHTVTKTLDREGVRLLQNRALFERFDADADGLIDISEMSRALAILLHITDGSDRVMRSSADRQKLVDLIFTQADRDNSGTLSFPEFVDFVEKVRNGEGFLFVHRMAGANMANALFGDKAIAKLSHIMRPPKQGKNFDLDTMAFLETFFVLLFLPVTFPAVSFKLARMDIHIKGPKLNAKFIRACCSWVERYKPHIRDSHQKKSRRAFSITHGLPAPSTVARAKDKKTILEMQSGTGAALKSAVRLTSKSYQTEDGNNPLYDTIESKVEVRPINFLTLLRCAIVWIFLIVPFWCLLFVVPTIYFSVVQYGDGGISYVEVVMPWACYSAVCLWISVLVSIRDPKLDTFSRRQQLGQAHIKVARGKQRVRRSSGAGEKFKYNIPSGETDFFYITASEIAQLIELHAYNEYNGDFNVYNGLFTIFVAIAGGLIPSFYRIYNGRGAFGGDQYEAMIIVASLVTFCALMGNLLYIFYKAVHEYKMVLNVVTCTSALISKDGALRNGLPYLHFTDCEAIRSWSRLRRYFKIYNRRSVKTVDFFLASTLAVDFFFGIALIVSAFIPRDMPDAFKDQVVVFYMVFAYFFLVINSMLFRLVFCALRINQIQAGDAATLFKIKYSLREQTANFVRRGVLSSSSGGIHGKSVSGGSSNALGGGRAGASSSLSERGTLDAVNPKDPYVVVKGPDDEEGKRVLELCCNLIDDLAQVILLADQPFRLLGFKIDQAFVNSFGVALMTALATVCAKLISVDSWVRPEDNKYLCTLKDA